MAWFRRRLWLCLLLAVVPAAARGAAAPRPAAVAPVVLRVATWDVYCDPQRPDRPLGWREFTARTGASLEATVFPSNDAILRAMRAGGFDLCVVSSDVVPVLVAEGLLAPLPVARLPHYRDLLPELKHVRYGVADGRDHCVPFAWGEMGLAYDTAVFPEPPRSWQVLWDPAWRGRIAHWDDISAIWTAALADGRRDVYTLEGQQLWDAARRAARLQAAEALLWSDERTQVEAMAAGRIVLNVTWPNAVAKVNRIADRRSGRWAVAWPREGVTGFIDNVCVAASCPRPELARLLADEMLTPEFQLAMTAALDYAPVSAVAVARLGPERRAQLHLDDPNRVNRFYLWQPVPARAEYERLWGEARAGRLVQ
jgi:spermidine/putrescine-binding protein